tara:strand:+ start:130 stop:960 length:831 start_codon:yes stop_codon:yes gene_type:complete
MNKKKIIEKFRNSLLIRTLKLIKLNKKLFFLTLAFDFLFITSLYFLGQLISALITANIPGIANFLMLPILTLLFAVSFSIVYILLLILVYSFFKYNILDLIKSMNQKTEFDFKRFKKFYILNLITYISGFLIFLTASLIFMGIKPEYISITSLIIFIPLGLLFYSFLNFSHSYFASDALPVKAVLKRSLKKISKISSYYKVYLITLAYFLVYFIIYYPIALLLKTILIQKYSLLGFFPIYSKIFSVITAIVMFGIIAHNRVYFYMTVKEEDNLTKQ